MLYKVVWLALLLGAGQADYTWHHQTSDYPRENVKLVGHELLEIEDVAILTQCGYHCLKTPGCKSYNLDQDTEICTLNDADDEDGDFQDAPTSIFARVDSYRIDEVRAKLLAKNTSNNRHDSQFFSVHSKCSPDANT